MAAAAIPAPTKATCPFFYRYATFTDERKTWLKDTILEHRIYVPNLPQLNDPADGRPKLVYKSEDELFTLLYNSPSGVLGRNPHMSGEAKIKEGLILDYNLRHHGVEVVMKDTAQSLYKELEDWRICCLSKRWNNMSMWAKYADGHKGYCLEFANVGLFFGSAREVSYGDPIEIDITVRENLDGRWFFRKTLDWSNEEEIRVLVPRRSASVTSIDPTWLTRIILGWKMPDADRKMICEWAKQRSPELKVLVASYDELKQALQLADCNK
jgi:hypothetical protein